MIDVWNQYTGTDMWESRYLPTALEISDWGDSAIYVLNPRVVRANGEWEAAFFANWNPGARVYESFQELMLAEYTTFCQLHAEGMT